MSGFDIRRLMSAICLSLLATLLVSCSDDTTSPPAPVPETSVTIGAGGGTVASPDGKAELVIPAGALTGDVTITVKAAGNTSLPIIDGTHYEFGPEGTVFEQPVALTMVVDKDAVSSASIFIVRVDEENGYVELTESDYDADAGAVTSELQHFSRYGVTEWTGYQNAPIGDPRARWDGEQNGIVVTWEEHFDRTIVIKRTGVNSFGTPPLPEAIYAVRPSYYNPILIDRAMGGQAKIYWYWLQARTGDYLYPPTQPMFVTYFGPGGDVPDPIEAFTVWANPQNDTAMKMSWHATPTAAGYDLEVLVAGGPGWTEVASGIPYTTTTYEDLGLPEDTDVTYRIRGTNEHGLGPWRSVSGHTGARCAIIVEVAGAPTTEPVLPGTAVTLIANSCGDGRAGEVFEWWYIMDHGGGMDEEHKIGEGTELVLEVTADTRLRLTVTYDGSIIENRTLTVPVIASQAYSEIFLSATKPRANQSFTATLRTIDSGAYHDITDIYPEVTSIEWIVYSLVDFVPTGVLLTQTLAGTSSITIPGGTLTPGWYDLRAIGRTVDDAIFVAPLPRTFEVLP
ncbi:MAG: hypothetical protein GY838_07345 [bacterium]|nr:hypothetical protein [bacterium]